MKNLPEDTWLMDELWSRIPGLTPGPLLLIENNPGKNQFPRPGLSFLTLNTTEQKVCKTPKVYSAGGIGGWGSYCWICGRRGVRIWRPLMSTGLVQGRKPSSKHVVRKTAEPPRGLLCHAAWSLLDATSAFPAALFPDLLTSISSPGILNSQDTGLSLPHSAPINWLAWK